jgi:ribosomal protein L37AE/L43A
MLNGFDVESDMQVCSVDRAGLYMGMVQRRSHSWVVQFDDIPRRTNKELTRHHRYFVRIWKITRSGNKFVGFCLLPQNTLGRVLARYSRVIYKQLLVKDRFFETTFSLTAGAMPVNVLCGFVVPLANVQDSVDPILPGTVLDNHIVYRHSNTIRVAMESPAENLWAGFVYGPSG